MPATRLALLLAVLAMMQVVTAAAGRADVERLYILNCGEGVAGDISRWSPGVNVGKSMDFVDSCYLVRHSQGWLLWDTGLADAIATMPDGLKPADPRAIHWRRPKTLAAQLEQLNVKAADIRYAAVSHSHPDHIGNVAMFPQSTRWCRRPSTNGRVPTVRGSSRDHRFANWRAISTSSATAAS